MLEEDFSFLMIGLHSRVQRVVRIGGGFGARAFGQYFCNSHGINHDGTNVAR